MRSEWILEKLWTSFKYLGKKTRIFYVPLVTGVDMLLVLV